MGYPSYASNRVCALPSSSLFHYVMAKIVPTEQLAVHAKSSILYGHPYGHRSKSFRRDGLLLCRIIMGLRCAHCQLRSNSLMVLDPTIFEGERSLLRVQNLASRYDSFKRHCLKYTISAQLTFGRHVLLHYVPNVRYTEPHSGLLSQLVQ